MDACSSVRVLHTPGSVRSLGLSVSADRCEVALAVALIFIFLLMVSSAYSSFHQVLKISIQTFVQVMCSFDVCLAFADSSCSILL